MPKPEFDYSTINQEELAKLPVVKLPPTYHLQGTRGNACSGDPPGYPTYFTRSVYTSHGNDPGKGASMTLLGRVVERADDGYDEAKREAKYRRLWNPLPLDHPRTVEWIRATYRHLAHCYTDPGPFRVVSVYANTGAYPRPKVGTNSPAFNDFAEAKAWADKEHGKGCGPEIVGTEKSEYGYHPAMVIYPVPYYKLRHFHDDPRFSDERRFAEQAAVDAYNDDIRHRYSLVCTPENHQAAKIVQRYYPEHRPLLEYIESPESIPPSTGNWWERYAERPSPEDCPGDSVGRHPVGGTHCQACGYSAPEKAQAAQ